jgi:uncharacterized protein (DUF2235 family)
MPKKIVLCCDGTNNEFGDSNTNVVKLYGALRHDTPQQIACYHPGLGSMGAPSALTPLAKEWTKFFGFTFGYGLSQHLIDLYVYLMRNYEPGDHLYIFGFSRGAYTARAICSMLHVFGLIRAGQTVLIPYAIRLLKKYGVGDNRGIADRFRQMFSSQYVKPHFVGVWDTVSSVGALHNPLTLPFSAYNPDINIGRHAISIDERRAFFRTNLWTPDAKSAENIKQVWFAGVHSDVGGGFPEPDSGLSKIALEWMLSEAHKAGLLLDPAKVDYILGRTNAPGIAKPDPTAAMHHSPRWWMFMEVIPRRRWDPATRAYHWKVPLGKPRFIKDDALIHQSVFDRMAADSKYRPVNVPKGSVERTDWGLSAAAS